MIGSFSKPVGFHMVISAPVPYDLDPLNPYLW